MISHILAQATSTSTPTPTPTSTSTSPPGDSQYIVNVLKYTGAVLAAIVGILGAIPATAGYLAKRKATVYQTRLLRMSKLKQPAPWQGSKGWPAGWTDERTRHSYWRVRRIRAQALGLVAGAYCAGAIYFIQGGPHSAVTFTLLYVIAVLFGVFFAVSMKYAYDLSKPEYKEVYPFRTETTFTVKGLKKDVVQYCYVVLASIGATIVQFDEESGTILASQGLWILPLYHGARLSVSISADPHRSGLIVVTMASEDISPAVSVSPPHARNVKRFLRQWNFSGIEQQETKD